MRRRLSYANVMATLAFFFALTGASMAGVKYIAVGDPAGGDLTGTFPNPTIAAGKVTTDKIADGAITSAKLDSSVTVPTATSVGGLDVQTTTSGPFTLAPFATQTGTTTCAPDRIAVHAMASPFPQVGFTNFPSYSGRSATWTVENFDVFAGQDHSVTVSLSCFGATAQPLGAP